VNVAITGATGFVGSHLAEALAARGHTLACLVRRAEAEPALAALGARCVRGDLEDEAALASLAGGAHLVFHVAGRVTAPSAEAFLRTNRDGTARVARVAREAGVRRLVYVSSLAVTGPTLPGRPLDESGPPRPVTAYGRSKLAGEDAVRASGLPFTIVRPPIVYGPRDREVLRLFRMARWPLCPLLGDGAQELSLVHARDLARALVAAGESEAALGGTFHAGHPRTTTQRGLLEAIARAVGSRPRLVPVPRPAVRALLHLTGSLARLRGRATLLSAGKADELLAPAWTCSSAALEHATGWRAEVDLDEGLEETARAHRDAGWL